MSQTPTKNVEQVSNFRPREIGTPNKDSHGISKTVFTHVSKLHGLLSDWIKVRDRGTKLCRSIASLKLHECAEDYFPHPLKPLIETLQEALDTLKNIVDGVSILNNQLQALSKLQPTDEPVIFTWSATQISQNVFTLYDTLQKEYKLKQVIVENVAHCRNEKLIDVYVGAWELEMYFNADDSAYLFAEVGLPGIM